MLDAIVDRRRPEGARSRGSSGTCWALPAAASRRPRRRGAARMTLEELTPWLFARTAGGIRWGLETTRELLAGAGDPHRQFRFAPRRRAPTGRGRWRRSATRRFARTGARRVGLYTSPHLVSFAERIRIDGRPADEAPHRRGGGASAAGDRAHGRHLLRGDHRDRLPLLRARRAWRSAVVEVGLGGRLDATNVLAPLVTAVTNVARTTRSTWASRLAAIAREKAGIFKAGVPALTAERGPRDAGGAAGSARRRPGRPSDRWRRRPSPRRAGRGRRGRSVLVPLRAPGASARCGSPLRGRAPGAERRSSRPSCWRCLPGGAPADVGGGGAGLRRGRAGRAASRWSGSAAPPGSSTWRTTRRARRRWPTPWTRLDLPRPLVAGGRHPRRQGLARDAGPAAGPRGRRRAHPPPLRPRRRAAGTRGGGSLGRAAGSGAAG